VRCCSSPQSRSCPSVISNRCSTAGDEVNLAHAVITEIEQVLTDLQDAETGQRGFLLTGDERFLKPYNAALAHLPDQIKALRRSPPTTRSSRRRSA
jgi:CHASE3 domain sensor protein